MSSNKELLAALQQAFPQLFSKCEDDGVTREKLDLEKIRLLAGNGNYSDKYGLRWEDKPEQFDADAIGKLPALTRLADKAIKSNPAKPTHVLIQGDNYHALKVLAYTHERAIDFIYIDPPYNTGNQDFKYNDRFVDREDGYRHSKWLSFMAKRLKLAKALLKEAGVLAISIDDNEQAPLKLLCDDVFGPENWIGTVPVITNLKGNNDQFGFAGTHEYVLCYAKSIKEAALRELPLDDEDAIEWLEDKTGPYKIGANLKATGQDGARAKRPNLFFPLYVTLDGKVAIERQSDADEEVWPLSDGKEMRWRWQRSTFERDADDVIVSGVPGARTIYKKQRPQLGDLPSKKPKSVLYHPAYSTGSATAELKDLFAGERAFNGPKALRFIKDLLQLACPSDGLVLDFFAGSGTTAHAAMQLNQADKGSRQCILVTNDEGNFEDNAGNRLPGGICTNVTYPRIKKVIEGYTTPKGKTVFGLGENLEFFQTAFQPVPESRDQLRNFVRCCSSMLCLKANAYAVVEETMQWSLFNGEKKHLFLLFDEYATEAAVKRLKDLSGPVEAYVFAYEHDDDSAEILRQLPNITVQEVPQPLLDLFFRTK